jgi:hypothetical protein
MDDVQMVNDFRCLNVCNKTNQYMSIKYVLYFILVYLLILLHTFKYAFNAQIWNILRFQMCC